MAKTPNPKGSKQPTDDNKDTVETHESHTAKDALESGTDLARKIWLAGVGAYGKAFSEAQEGLSKMTKGSSKVFDDLAQKGEAIETVVKVKGKSVAKGTADKFSGMEIDERIEKMRARLKRSLGDHDHDHEDGDDAPPQTKKSRKTKYAAKGVDYDARLTAIETKLDELLARTKPVVKRTPARRKPASRTTASAAPKIVTKAKAKPKSAAKAKSKPKPKPKA